MIKSRRPRDKPLEMWPLAWLKLEVASRLDDMHYLLATDEEKQQRGQPVSAVEMIRFIRAGDRHRRG